jgi:hypothetical protein
VLGKNWIDYATYEENCQFSVWMKKIDALDQLELLLASTVRAIKMLLKQI